MDELEQPTTHEDTSNDHERLERRLLAQDRDRRSEDVVSIDESVASDLVYVLRDQGIVDVIPEDELLVHVPSGKKFQSNLGLAYFQQGWEASE